MEQRDDERGVVDGELWGSLVLLGVVLLPLMVVGLLAGGLR